MLGRTITILRYTISTIFLCLSVLIILVVLVAIFGLKQDYDGEGRLLLAILGVADAEGLLLLAILGAVAAAAMFLLALKVRPGSRRKQNLMEAGQPRSEHAAPDESQERQGASHGVDGYAGGQEPQTVEAKGEEPIAVIDISGDDTVPKEVRAWRLRAAGWTALLCLGIALVYVGWSRMQNTNWIAPQLEPLFPGAGKQNDSRREEMVNRIYSNNIAPLILEMTKKNQEAADRAVATIQKHFREFHNGVPEFVDDMFGFGTQWAVLRRLAADQWDKWWNDKTEVQRVTEYASSKFRDKVLSEEKLKSAVSQAIDQFRQDLTANRNAMESKAKVDLASLGLESDIPMTEPEWNALLDTVNRSMEENAREMATGSVGNGIIVVVGSAAAEEAARRLVQQVFSRAAARIATTLATRSVGTLGIASSLGGAGGSLIGPEGTLVGIGVGVAVGALAGYWMDAHFKDKLREQIAEYLDLLEKQILDGNSDDSSLSQGTELGGVRDILAETNRVVDEAMQTGMRKGMLQTMIARAEQ